MNTLIVCAHPEPRSFTAALRDVATDTLRAQGHVVEVSDLYAMRFNPVAGPDDFLSRRDPDYLNVSLEQRHALQVGSLAPEIARELARLQQADLLIFQFPLWWFGLPAILKGWIDRVFVSGAVYGRSAMFERGKFRGKRALVCVTTGAPSEAFGPQALNGDLLDLLMPLHRGVFGFTGMTVLPPFIGHHVPYVGDSGRAAILQGYREHLGRLDQLMPLPMPRMEDHPERGAGDARPAAQ